MEKIIINGIGVDVNDSDSIARAWEATRGLTQDKIGSWLKTQGGAPRGMEPADLEQELYLVFYDTLIKYSEYETRSATFTTIYYKAIDQHFIKLYGIKRPKKPLDHATSLDESHNNDADGEYTLYDIIPSPEGREMMEANTEHIEATEAIQALLRRCNEATRKTWEKRLTEVRAGEIAAEHGTTSRRETEALQHMRRDMQRQLSNIGVVNGTIIQEIIPSTKVQATKHYYNS